MEIEQSNLTTMLSDGHAHPIRPIYHDPRAEAAAGAIVYKTLHQLRCDQLRDGVDTRALSDTMWGLVPLHRCHHVSCVTNSHQIMKKSQSASSLSSTLSSPSSTVESAPMTTYRVRICKTCCGETGHIELGTYNDQESAILVNDGFEILQGRYERLLVLTPSDLAYLPRIMVQRCDRSKGKEVLGLVEVLSERRRQVYSSSNSTVVSVESNPHPHPAVGRKRSSSHLLPSPSVSSTVQSQDSGSKRRGKGSSSPSTSSVVSVTSDESSPSLLLLSRASPAAEAAVAEEEMEVEERETTDDRDSSSSVVSETEREVERDAQTTQTSQTQDIVATEAKPAEKKLSPRSEALQHMDSSPSVVRRPRAYTFSTSSDYVPVSSHEHTAIEALTWLAELGREREEVDVAQSLFSLAHPASTSVSPPLSQTHTETQTQTQTERDTPTEKEERRGRSDSIAAILEAAEQQETETGDKRDMSLSSSSLSLSLSATKKQVVILTPVRDNLSVHRMTEREEDEAERGVLDRLSLLTQSAGLLASPLSSPQQRIPFSAHRPSSLFRDADFTSPALSRAHVQQQQELAVSSSAGGRRPRSQSLSAVDLPWMNNSHSLQMLSPEDRAKGDVSSGHLPILRVLNHSPSHILLLQKTHTAAGCIGIYSPAERQVRLRRFMEKRKHRMWLKKIKYDVRKNFADSRVRIKGRFVKKEEEKLAVLLSSSQTPSASASLAITMPQSSSLTTSLAATPLSAPPASSSSAVSGRQRRASSATEHGLSVPATSSSSARSRAGSTSSTTLTLSAVVNSRGRANSSGSAVSAKPAAGRAVHTGQMYSAQTPVSASTVTPTAVVYTERRSEEEDEEEEDEEDDEDEE